MIYVVYSDGNNKLLETTDYTQALQCMYENKDAAYLKEKPDTTEETQLFNEFVANVPF